jgi:hypothetical protein
MKKCNYCAGLVPEEEYDSRGWCHTCYDMDIVPCQGCTETGRTLDSDSLCMDCADGTTWERE